MEIYKSDNLKIEVETNNQLLIMRWFENTANLTQETLIQESMKIVEEIHKNKVRYLISDDRQFLFPIGPELQKQMAAQMLTQLNAVGLVRFAHINSTELLAQLSVSQFMDENTDANYKDKYFDNEIVARKWLFDEEDED
jgi:hypothetical protein